MSYHKAALMLHTLERIYTWEVMQKVMSIYFARWKFKHPQPSDFFDVLNDVTGKDHKWFIDQVYTSSNKFDYAIDGFTSEPIGARGLMESPEGLKFQETKVDGQFRTTVVARRLEAGQFPVDVLVTFSNGEQAREAWDGRGRWQVFTFDRPVKAVSAQIDPEREAPARHQLHEQQQDDGACGGARGHEVVAQVDGVAAGSIHDLGLPGMSALAGCGLRT
jgi:hypothetical protein